MNMKKNRLSSLLIIAPLASFLIQPSIVLKGCPYKLAAQSLFQDESVSNQKLLNLNGPSIPGAAKKRSSSRGILHQTRSNGVAHPIAKRSARIPDRGILPRGGTRRSSHPMNGRGAHLNGQRGRGILPKGGSSRRSHPMDGRAARLRRPKSLLNFPQISPPQIAPNPAAVAPIYIAL